MGISINTNTAATNASYFLAKNHAALQKSLDRLSSGKRITEPADDAGGLAVSMKLSGSIDRLNGAANNVSNAISFLQVQDGILESAAQIIARMAELKSLSSDVIKSADDKLTYNSEFQDLQRQLHQLSGTTFNGQALFNDGAKDFDTMKGAPTTAANIDVLSVYPSENGNSATAPKIDIHKSYLLSAVTIDNTAGAASSAWTNATESFASDGTTLLFLEQSQTTGGTGTNFRDTAAFSKALDNIAYLRAQNGGSVKRLMFAQENISSQLTNLTAANGRIMDVDVAEESANLARQQVLVQASAAMVAQAKLSANVALTLLQ